MNLAAACGWTLLRSLLVALVTVPLCWAIRQQLATLSSRLRTLLWTLILIPFFTPALLTGYGYSSFSISLIRHQGWNEVLYSALMGLRFLAVGVVIMRFAPGPPVTAAALHCARLQLPAGISPWHRIKSLWPHLIRGRARAAFPAAAVVFLFAFQEFETASLMGVTSWTVWLFDAQAGGLTLGRSLRAALIPASCELVVLVPLMTLTFRSQFLPASPSSVSAKLPTPLRCLVWGVACGGGIAVFAIPLCVVGQGTLTGLATVLRNRQMLEEIVAALGFGLASGIPAALFAAASLRVFARSAFARTPLPRHVAQAMCGGLSLPGMLGALPISLFLLWLFQLPVFNAAYDTPVPAALALFLFLLPRAFLLLILFATVTPQQSVHVARLLEPAPDQKRRATAAELRWQLQSRRYFLATGILCLWGYLELTPVAILAPPGMTSAPVRLYNLMHYGRSMVLSAMVMLAMLAPLVAFLTAAVFRMPLGRVFRIFHVRHKQSSGD